MPFAAIVTCIMLTDIHMCACLCVCVYVFVCVCVCVCVYVIRFYKIQLPQSIQFRLIAIVKWEITYKIPLILQRCRQQAYLQ